MRRGFGGENCPAGAGRGGHRFGPLFGQGVKDVEVAGGSAGRHRGSDMAGPLRGRALGRLAAAATKARWSFASSAVIAGAVMSVAVAHPWRRANTASMMLSGVVWAGAVSGSAAGWSVMMCSQFSLRPRVTPT